MVALDEAELKVLCARIDFLHATYGPGHSVMCYLTRLDLEAVCDGGGSDGDRVAPFDVLVARLTAETEARSWAYMRKVCVALSGLPVIKAGDCWWWRGVGGLASKSHRRWVGRCNGFC